MTDIAYMQVAIEEAKKGMAQLEVPIGAVIVKDGDIIAKAHNLKETHKNPICHAEIIAISRAVEYLGDWRLNESCLYVTAEPCIMCAGAILQARISRVVFGVTEPKFGGIITHANLFDIQKLNHHVDYSHGILADEITQLMKDFFVMLRKKN